MATKLDLADAQFIGFKEGKWSADIIALVKAMGLTKGEWSKWKDNYVNVLDDNDFQAVENYFKQDY